ncbi:hypothetical protein B0T25DRAFT_521440 [Lasiosphaeria hispida]|uniref:Fe2OG dioxygenase domain-containing protein n=1 Tax=Lasiosphaeria hispida TaxID=260671 RepID=A0AAJ0HD68_9PEZI|nr:hypothetical protein B0T25DRAFT_521440 [Lasiosphaeria hispida]
MPGMFPINAAILPPVHTRKALMVIDLQNDLVSPDGALPVTEPEGFVARTLALVKDFRASGLGDVIWVRSEFEEHRPLSAEADQIIVTDVLPRPSRVQARGRQAASRPNPGAAHEAEAEAFLSAPPGCDKPLCVRKGTSGSELAPSVQEAVVTERDIIFTKTHYSAFASGQQQLVQLLRSRFVTEMYICGALTNVSIHATAVDAGRHGYDMTIVEDCCGFRSELRHIAAIRQMAHLTGSEVITAENVKKQLKEFIERKIPKSMEPPRMRSKKTDGDGKGAGGSGVGKESPVRPLAAQSQSTGLSPIVSNISLSRGDDNSPVASPSLQPTASSSDSAQPQQQSKEKPIQPVVAAKTSSGSGGQSVYIDPPLEAGSAVQTSDEGESLQDMQKLRGAARGAMQAAASQKDPEFAPSSPQSARRVSASVATKVKTRRRTRAASSGESASVQHPPSPTKKVETPPAKKPFKVEPPSAETVSKKVKLEEPKPLEPEPIVASTPKPPNMTNQEQVATPTFSEPMCDGDTTIITNTLPPNVADTAFDRLLSEVSWAGMSHLGGEVPRRIAVQGEVDGEGNMPVYRHPADESPPLLPFSPTVLEIKKEVEKHLGHPLNHVLIQHYRSGSDYISDHSDKSLDIVRGSFIANISLGAERTMVFRTKRPPKDTSAAKTPAAASSDDDAPKPAPKASEKSSEGPKRQIQRAPLPHNSLCRMGLGTNMRWLHAIRPDKRADREKSPAELAFAGARISLTFRRIGTFLDASQTHIWGQGATVKTLPERPKEVSNGQTPEAVRMLQAFGAENHSSEFDWDLHYGTGFDVLHMGTPKRFCAGTRDPVGNMRVALALAEMGVGCAKGSVEGDVKFEDNDVTRTVVEGHETVLRYLDAVYGPGKRYDQLGAAEVAKRFVRLQKGLNLLGVWRTAIKQAESRATEADKTVTDDKEKPKACSDGPAALIKKELAEWEGYAEEAAKTAATTEPTPADSVEETPSDNPPFYIADTPQPSPADFALWPVLHDIVRVAGGDVLKGALGRYYTAFHQRSAAMKVLGGGKEKTL